MIISRSGGSEVEITEQEQDSLLEMTMALSKFLNSHELDDIIRVYLGLIERLKDEGNGGE